MGSPLNVISQQINVDNMGRNAYHSILYKGNYEVLIMLLNIERVYMKKVLYDQLCNEKNRFRFKNMDIEHGKLTSSVFHDEESIKRHEEFNMNVINLFENYAKNILDRTR